MYWFGRPSYLRWVAAAILVVGAAVIDLWPTTEAAYPFTAGPVAAGESPEVEWRRLPVGWYQPPVIGGAVAAHPMAAGEPITASDLQRPVGVPDGWWALAIDVPTVLAPGSATQLVLGGGAPVSGIVIRVEASDPFDLSGPTALIAVPGDEAGRVAAASAARQVTVLMAPRDLPGVPVAGD